MNENNQGNIDNTQTIQQPIVQQPQPSSLTDELAKLQDKWTNNIKELNDQMKNLPSIDQLMNEIYYKRQEALDLYFGTNRVLAERTRDYKSKAAQIYLALKSGQANLRFTNEQAINLQIESRLVAEKETLDVMNNFVKFMEETVKTIDNIIFGINYKIKVHEMMNGLKF